MKIHVHLVLRQYVGNREELEVPVTGSVPLRKLLPDIGIPEAELGIIMKNGRSVFADAPVSDSDELYLYPELCGG